MIGVPCYQIELKRVQVAEFALILEALDFGEAIALQINHLEAGKLVEILNAHETLIVQIQLVVQLGRIVQLELAAQLFESRFSHLHGWTGFGDLGEARYSCTRDKKTKNARKQYCSMQIPLESLKE
jgi:hypothetical protein